MGTVDALIRILRTPDIESAMATLAVWAATVSKTPNPSIFMLSTQRAAFVGLFGHREGSVVDPDIAYSDQRHVLAKRGDLAIGFLEWDKPISPISNEDREVINAVLEEIYRRLYARNFLVNIRRPIDFTNQETYFRETARLLSDTLSMEMVAIRQVYNVNSLDCRVFFHYPDQFGDRIDYEWDSMPPPFAEVITETRRALSGSGTDHLVAKFEIVDRRNEDRYGFLWDNAQLEKVKAFVVFPIAFGGEFFGVASCATTVAVTFSTLEQTAIQTAMQLVGIAISNFTKYHEAKRMTDVVHDQLLSATQLEIAQSARHELQNIEAEQGLLVDELGHHTRHIKDKGTIPDIVAKLKDSIQKLAASTSKLRYSSVHAAPVLKNTSVAQVWDEAIDLIKERISMMSIKTRYVGSTLEGYYYSDWLREAFLNLLFNSIDAFRERPRQSRQVTLVVQKESGASQYNLLDYSDNAGGIAFGKLVVPEPIKDANPGMEPEQMIFQPRVTSKKNKQGAGWGLYLVRQALRLHNSSISLRGNSKEGCTFRIQLRKDLREQNKR